MTTKTTTKSIFDERYVFMIEQFVKLRQSKELTQRDLAKRLGVSNCCVARVETRERRIDCIEMIDFLRALGLTDSEITDFLAVVIQKH